MDQGRRNSLKAGLGALSLGITGAPHEIRGEPALPPPRDRLAEAWFRRCHLVQVLAASRHVAIGRMPATEDSEDGTLADGEARIGAFEAEIVRGRARTVAGLAAQACLLSEYCELGTRADDNDLVLARKVAAALVSLADQEAGTNLPEI